MSGVLSSCSPAARPANPRAAALVAPGKSGGKVGSAPGPRLFPSTRGPGTVQAGVERDGSRRLLAFGLRVVEHPDGSLNVGEELLPAARSAKFLELPARLDGGFLFWIVSSSATLLYRAESWTGRLEPVAQLDFEVERLVPGFDRLLLLPKRESDYRALDLETGEPAPLVGLPAAPAYGSMAFVDGWFGAVQVPLRGVLVSFDAGGSWRPLDLPVASFEPAGAALSITTPTADYLLSSRGVLSHVRDRDPAKVSEAAQAELARALLASERAGARTAPPLLETAALYGYPDGHGAALLATAGMLARVALDTGKILERKAHAYVGAADCQGVALGKGGVGFVCGQGQELTRIYRLTEPFGLDLLLELPGARVVSASGSGGLAVLGSCTGQSSKPVHCIVPAEGPPREVLASSDLDRVVALADGRVAILSPPAAGRSGSLSLIASGGGITRVKLKLPRLEPRQKTLFDQGLWLDGMTEGKPGTIAGWVVGGGPFAGVQVAADGTVELRRIEEHASRALFAGKRALLLGPNGLATETTDGGAQWLGVELPPDIDLKSLGASGFRQGCSAVGCVFAGFTRIGYFDGRAARSLAAPASPARVQFPSPGGGRWVLHCNPTGEVSAPALPARAQAPLSSRRPRAIPSIGTEELELPPLSPLLDAPPPKLAENVEGIDAGTEPFGVQTRLYVFGPRGTDWTKTGSLRIAFADRFSVAPSVHLTANTRSPWPDASTTADALGAEPSTSAAGMAAALDPSGTSGALLLSSRGMLDLFLFEAGRAPTRIANVARQGMASRISGVVKAKSGFFIGSYDENTKAFRVYSVVGQKLDVLLEATDIPPARGANAELVRTASGDALGIWVRGTGWFVHPIDADTGLVEAPYAVMPPELAALPRVCSESAEGFVVSGAVTPDPYTELPGGMSARSIEGRFRVSALGVCIERLAAQGEKQGGPSSAGMGGKRAGASSGKALAASARAAGSPTVNMTLSERKPLGRRLGLRCSN